MSLRRFVLMPILCVVILSNPTAMAVEAQQPAPDNWLPPNVVEGLSQQLVGRLETATGKPAADRDSALRGARVRVRNLRAAIGAWSVPGVVDRAPKPEGLTLPQTNNEYLDAVARYHVCNLILLEQHERGDTVQERQVSALGLTGLTVVQARLLAPYLARGGTEARVATALTGPFFATLLEQTRSDPATLARVRSACGPVLGDVLDMMQ